MLYRTHHLPHPFTLLSSHPLPHLLSSSSSTQVEQGMECVEGALKSSFRPEILVKTTTHYQQPPSFSDDFHAQTGVSGDDFFVDDLLDLSEDGFEETQLQELNPDETQLQEPNPDDKNPISPPPATETETATATPTTTTNFSVKDVSLSLPLCVPADELAELEWMSHFVDDSSCYSLTAKFPEKVKHSPAPENLPADTVNPSFTVTVQTKARSKRTRTGGRVWSLGSPAPLTDSSTSSSSSSSCTSNPWLIFSENSSQTAESFLGKRPPVKTKKQRKKKPASEPGQQTRRCSHCGVQKTPQWRAGPLGSKTLCNACGVRYKSGRLLPEYRPACSPTFSSEVHSNNHRKVLEMRRKKEAEGGGALPVQSL